MKHDYKLISRNAYIPQGDSHPSLTECMAWGIGCAVIWIAVGALALHKLGML
jgi:hypothetical protein